MFTDRVGNYGTGAGTGTANKPGAAPMSTKENPKQLPSSQFASEPQIPPAKVPVSIPVSSKKDDALPGPGVWVKKWVDYSSKYGLGYMLSNGCSGVFFNDSTKIVLDLNAHDFYYYERKSVDSGEKQDVMTAHNLNTYPKEL